MQLLDLLSRQTAVVVAHLRRVHGGNDRARLRSVVVGLTVIILIRRLRRVVHHAALERLERLRRRQRRLRRCCSALCLCRVFGLLQCKVCVIVCLFVIECLVLVCHLLRKLVRRSSRFLLPHILTVKRLCKCNIIFALRSLHCADVLPL